MAPTEAVFGGNIRLVSEGGWRGVGEGSGGGDVEGEGEGGGIVAEKQKERKACEHDSMYAAH